MTLTRKTVRSSKLRRARDGKPANPIKDQGTSKRRARELVDQARHAKPRAATEGRTKRAASARGDRPRAARFRADTSHPGQRGGFKAAGGQSSTRENTQGRKRSGELRAGLSRKEDA